MADCYVTLPLTPSGLNLCQIVNTLDIKETLNFILNIDSNAENL
jgi:hypothetical protein